MQQIAHEQCVIIHFSVQLPQLILCFQHDANGTYVSMSRRMCCGELASVTLVLCVTSDGAGAREASLTCKISFHLVNWELIFSTLSSPPCK